jgi:hypothetical protein
LNSDRCDCKILESVNSNGILFTIYRHRTQPVRNYKYALIKAYNIDSDLHGLKSHSIFKSVYTVKASWKGTFGHLMQTASAESRFSLEDLRRRSIDPTRASHFQS